MNVCLLVCDAGWECGVEVETLNGRLSLSLQYAGRLPAAGLARSCFSLPSSVKMTTLS
jgi:hypothetical protein